MRVEEEWMSHEGGREKLERVGRIGGRVSGKGLMG